MNLIDMNGLQRVTGIVGVGGSGLVGFGGEGSQGIFVNSSGDVGGFVSAGGGAGVNISADVFGGVYWGDSFTGTTVNANFTIGPISVTIMTQPGSVESGTTPEVVGFTLGGGPALTPVGGSSTVSYTQSGTAINVLSPFRNPQPTPSPLPPRTPRDSCSVN